MDVNNLYFAIKSCNEPLVLDGLSLFFNPSTIMRKLSTSSNNTDEVIVLETDDNNENPRLISRYQWSEWEELWLNTIVRDYPEAEMKGLLQYDLSAWDDDIIQAIVVAAGETLEGNR